MTESEKEYADELKRGIKGLVDDINTDTEIGQKVIELVHAFTYSGYLECLGRKEVRHTAGGVAKQFDTPLDKCKAEIMLMASELEDKKSIDMAYGFVKGLYKG